MHVRVQDSAFQVQKAFGAGGGNSADVRFTGWGWVVTVCEDDSGRSLRS